MRIINNLKFLKRMNLNKCFKSHSKEIEELNRNIYEIKCNNNDIRKEVLKAAKECKKLIKYIKKNQK